jgi:hypothetical protein
MKYLKRFRIYEGYINPISDYLTDFIDTYNFEISIPEPGIVQMNLNSSEYDAHQILDFYEELLERLEDDDFVIKKGGFTYIQFFSEGVNIRIHRIIKDMDREYEFSSEAQRLAKEAISEAIKPKKLRLNQIYDSGDMKFDRMDDNISGTSGWVEITRFGKVRLPILRSRASQRLTQLPFTGEDIKWFKRLLKLDRDDYKSDEYTELSQMIAYPADFGGEDSQRQLREKYK